jgi:O-antigen biosynthesis protein WbqP
MKRIFDFFIAASLMAIFTVPMLVIAVLVRFTSNGPAIHWSKRIGQYNKVFLMPKFRTMHVETPQLATHLLDNSDQYITPIGKFLRKTSLDELPQIYSVLFGDMSFVGPRPALYNQEDLIEIRTQEGVHVLKPGITGWAQINGRDELPIPVKVSFDKEYLSKQSLLFDLKILFFTVFKVLKSEGVQH